MNCKIILPPNDIYKLHKIPATFDELMREIQTRLRGAAKEADSFTLKYMDAENELVTLSNQEDLNTAIVSGEAEKLKNLKIYVFITESPKNTLRNMSVNCNGTVKVRVKAKTETGKKAQNESITPEKAEEIQVKSTLTPKSTPRRSMSGGFGEMALSNQQLEAIKDFVGNKVKEALETNMKNLVPEFISKLQSHDQSPLNRSIVRDLSSSFTQELNQSLNSSAISTDFPANFLLNSSSNNGSDRSSPVCTECKEADHTVRYVCPLCADYKSCEKCEEKIRHEHNLLKLRATDAQNLHTSFKGNYSMQLSFPRANQSQMFSSTGLKVLNQKLTTEKKINYKGIAYLERTKDQLVHVGTNESYSLNVVAKNIGRVSWPESARLSCVNGVYRGKNIPLGGLGAGEKKVIKLRLKAPRNAGKQLTQWRLYYEDLETEKQRSFGESLFLEMDVKEVSREESKEKENVNGLNVHKNGSGNKYKEMMKLAEYLDEIFPGNLDEKIKFVEKQGSVGEMDMVKVVEAYLQEHVKGLRMVKKGSGCRPESEKISEKWDDVSVAQ
jgi:hypothetical protein